LFFWGQICHPGFDVVLKGRGFSRAARRAKSTGGFSRRAPPKLSSTPRRTRIAANFPEATVEITQFEDVKKHPLASIEPWRV
jgi:hypothetical protein